MSLSEEAITLQRAAHELMYLGMDGSPVYSDDLSRRNGEVYRLTMALYRSGVKGTTIEEQANVCLALLMGYSASFVDHGEKQRHVQKVLDCCWDVLDALPASLLKLRLLTACTVKCSTSLWPTRAVPSSPLGIPYHLLPNSRKRLMSFRM